jgi:IclR family transcriptional regulator, acetate operon repressor
VSAALERGLRILEHLVGQPEGMALTELADELEIPHSACHRLLAVLRERGYVRQAAGQGPYRLSSQLVALGLQSLSSEGMVEIAEPLLERLAQASGELVRLAIVDDERLTWVAKAQGTRKGLRYDPDMGQHARLSCTASGHAWLMTLSDERALELVSRQGFGARKDYGPSAPTTVKSLLACLQAARERGVACIDEMFAPGMAALAAPVLRRGAAVAVISIAGPRLRLTGERMQALQPALLEAALTLGPMSRTSSLAGRSHLGKA